MNIQKTMGNFFSNACYAYCIAWLFSEEKLRKDIKLLTSLVLTAWNLGYLEDDAYVVKPVNFANMVSGEDIYKDVKKVKISSLSELPDGYYPVQYSLGNSSHFVICDKRGVVFDPWENSEHVKNGKPTSYRLYI